MPAYCFANNISVVPVQQVSGITAVVSSYTVTLTQTPVAGDVLILLSNGNTTGVNVTGVTETNVVWNSGYSTNINRSQDLWYGVVTAGAGTSISVNTNASANFIYNVSEWSGLLTTSGVDQHAGNTGTSSTFSTASLTPANMRNVLIVAETTGTGHNSSGPTNGFTALTSADNSYEFAYLVLASANGSYSTTWTNTTNTAFTAIIADFLAANNGTGIVLNNSVWRNSVIGK